MPAAVDWDCEVLLKAFCFRICHASIPNAARRATPKVAPTLAPMTTDLSEDDDDGLAPVDFEGGGVVDAEADVAVPLAVWGAPAGLDSVVNLGMVVMMSDVELQHV